MHFWKINFFSFLKEKFLKAGSLILLILFHIFLNFCYYFKVPKIALSMQEYHLSKHSEVFSICFQRIFFSLPQYAEDGKDSKY